jgi:predicted ATPase
MDRLRIQNLRSLVDTEYVDIKPLTVLVGRNSSGKSTFLRFFPLMKQTLETRTNEPILWYSTRYVDFGSFKESQNFNNKNNPITFEYEFSTFNDLSANNSDLFVYTRKYNPSKIQQKQIDRDTKTKILVKIEISKKYLKKFQICIESHILEFILEESEDIQKLQLIINGETFDNLDLLVSRDFKNMLPSVLMYDENKIYHSSRVFKDLLFKKITELAHFTTRDQTIEEIIDNINFGNSEVILNSLKKTDTTAKSLKNNLNSLQLNSRDFIEIQYYFLGSLIPGIIDLCNNHLQSYFTSVKYIAPLRASAERYYRIQGLSIDEIDPQGENLPMILHNMNDRDKRFFNQWIKENFGFEILSTAEGGHTSLTIKYDNKTKINLADTGFGYSQILPIILVLWQATQSRRRGLINLENDYRRRMNYFTIAIEQPELHLHPSLQAMLIDSFVKIILMSEQLKVDIKIIIETHSELMLNRIGYLIAKKYKDFNKDLVNVLIFDHTDSHDSNVRSTSYTTEGFLSSWPVGFFTPEGL